MPEKLSVSNATVIKGKKTLMIHCEANPDTKHWDEVILLSISAPTLRQSSKRLTLHPASNSQAHAEGITNVMPVAVVLVFIAITTAIVGSKMSSKARKK